MIKQNFYFHSLRFDFSNLESILRDGAILSKERQGKMDKAITFNGNSWISICKHMDDQKLFSEYARSAYDALIVNGLSIVLSGELRAIKTLFMPYDSLYDGIIKEEDFIRYSDCIDEYQVNDEIGKEYFLAIACPFMETIFSCKQNQKTYDHIKALMSLYNYDLPIISSSRKIFDEQLETLNQKVLRRII